MRPTIGAAAVAAVLLFAVPTTAHTGGAWRKVEGVMRAIDYGAVYFAAEDANGTAIEFRSDSESGGICTGFGVSKRNRYGTFWRHFRCRASFYTTYDSVFFRTENFVDVKTTFEMHTLPPGSDPRLLVRDLTITRCSSLPYDGCPVRR